jgi:hypothetical protein
MIRRPRTVSLLALDPDLGVGLTAEARETAARELRVHVMGLPAGPWLPRVSGGRTGLGLLIVDGLLIRETRAGGNCSAELLCPGDLVRPWQSDEESLIESEPSWIVPEDARVAMLDDNLTAALAQWPSVISELFVRAVWRARALSVQRTFAQLRRLDERTLLYLWHVGERVGRVTPHGVAVHLPLTQERLAALIGAHRPSLTSALSGLERAGALVRDGRHDLVLTPRAGELVDELNERAPRIAA